MSQVTSVAYVISDLNYFHSSCFSFTQLVKKFDSWWAITKSMHSIAIADFVVVMFTFITVATVTDVRSECETMKMLMVELKITTVTMLK